MAGNVEEWVNDWAQEDYYTVSPPNDPPGPLSGLVRVLRGGSWTSDGYYDAGILRVARRANYFPGVGDFHFGFRCSR